MKNRIAVFRGLVLVIGALMVSGCGASYQARSMDVKESMLVDPSRLQKGEKTRPSTGM